MKGWTEKYELFVMYSDKNGNVFKTVNVGRFRTMLEATEKFASIRESNKTDANGMTGIASACIYLMWEANDDILR